MVKVSISVLSVKLKELGESVKTIEEAGADYVHIDVMDGEFVNNKTPGLDMLWISKEKTNLKLDTHLMVENPINWIDDFSNSDIITFHIEALGEEEVDQIISELHERDILAGIAIKPDTPIEEILPYIDKVDMILVMTVEPGFGGQKLVESCLEKVKRLREIAPEMDIEVDGGITLDNIDKVKDAGANVIVAGTSFFTSDNKKYFIKKIRE